MMRGVMGLQISCSALVGVHSTIYVVQPDTPIHIHRYTICIIYNVDSWSIERFVCTHHIWAGKYSHMV
jgi:hypothetical protein